MKIERYEEALRLRLDGKTYAEIGAALKITRQRAQQILRPPVDLYESVRKQANGHCEDCGIEVKEGHVHHRGSTGLKPEDFNDRKNLQYLCASCHRIAHSTGDPMQMWALRLPASLKAKISQLAAQQKTSLPNFIRQVLEADVASAKRKRS
jgi:hypothetical protein